ncbi:hypothetical protein J1N35_044461 [Gossypium stocksii]|uniref:Aminotransferase-like plant mobile domain-containing protein n=1 Tax=Gossypium stocksii TaxID=47602 RepID=A0A9D3ZG83_9ROSI|nr:hypothetical protein J1N35_044461 [Gossypium stocksii]
MPLIRLDDKHISNVQLQMRPETDTFYLLCGECAVTLKDVTVQFGLSMDGEVVTRVVGFGNWSATCEQLLGRIEMKWSEENFNYIDNLMSDVERKQYTRAFILRWNNKASHVGIVEELKDI